VVFLGAVWAERADLYASAQCFALGARKASFFDPAARSARRRPGASPRFPGEGTSRAGEHWSLAEMRGRRRPGTTPTRCSARLRRRRRDQVARAQAMARRHDWSVVVPRIRRVYDEALAARSG